MPDRIVNTESLSSCLRHCGAARPGRLVVMLGLIAALNGGCGLDPFTSFAVFGPYQLLLDASIDATPNVTVRIVNETDSRARVMVRSAIRAPHFLFLDDRLAGEMVVFMPVEPSLGKVRYEAGPENRA